MAWSSSMHNFPKIDSDFATFVKYNLTDSYHHHSCNAFNLLRFANVWKNCCLRIHDRNVTSTELRYYVSEVHNLSFLLHEILNFQNYYLLQFFSVRCIIILLFKFSFHISQGSPVIQRTLNFWHHIVLLYVGYL
jgi:hypothetical protein